MAAEGTQNIAIARHLGIERTIVGRWRRRFVAQGLAGLEKDAPRGGCPADTSLAREIVEYTTRCKPSCATTCRSTLSRVWRANDRKPHLVRTIKVSDD